MKTIQLTRGKFAIVDDGDFDLLSRFHWHAMRSGKKWRAVRTVGNGHKVSMHAQLLGFPDTEIDHRNRDPLDNRRCNLRLATHQQQMANSDRVPNQAGFRGVRKHFNRFIAKITVNKKTLHLGTFESAPDAAKAYDAAAISAFGEFAVVNFPTL